MRSLRRTLLSASLGLGVLLGVTATPAWAHVSVQPGEALTGTETKIAFRVPNEDDEANTVKVQVQLPAGLDEVSTRPLTGWTATISGSTITWAGGQIRPHQFEDFELSVALPRTDELVFKAVQTYDDGTVVRWVEPTPANGEEPEHPAPTLHLVAASAPGSDGDGDGAVAGAYVLGVIAVVLGGAALVLARRRRAAA